MSADSFQQALALAVALHQQGRLGDAESHCRALLRAAPNHPQVLQLLAVTLHRQGRSKQALPLLKKATTAAPQQVALWSSLAELQRACGKPKAAISSCNRGIGLAPDNFAAIANRGHAHQDLGDHPAAVEDFRQALRINPQASGIRMSLAEALLTLDQSQAAWVELERLAADQALGEQGPELLASAALQSHQISRGSKLLEAIPGTPALRARALLNYQAGHWIEALDALNAWLASDPNHRDAMLKKAAVLSALARHREAEAAYQALLKQAPEFSEAHSNYLVQLHYLYGRDNPHLFQQHLDWARAHIHYHKAPRRTPAGATAQPDSEGAPRRIGFICPRFTEGPPARLGLALIQQLARREALCVTLYRSADIADPMTDEFSRAANMVDVFDLDDQALAKQLTQDRIEVLIDLVGHAPGNRLKAMTGRLATLQMTWLDYFDTTGITAMDALVSDPVLTPKDSDQQFVEKLYRLPTTRWCYLPIAAPLTEARPGRPITFGSFNRLAKLTEETLACWCELLSAMPQSRLLLKAVDFSAEATRSAVHQRFTAMGIDADRIELRGPSGYADLLAEYADIDIALDPFPFTGCLTTCDALWMGVPVVSMAQDSMVSRQGASLLQCIGRDEWISDTSEAYINTARKLAQQIMAQGWSRASLRQQCEQSALLDHDAFASDFLDLLGMAWQDRLAQS